MKENKIYDSKERQVIENAISQVLSEEPDYKPYIKANENKDHSISIKSKNVLVAKIQIQKTQIVINLKTKQFKELDSLDTRFFVTSETGDTTRIFLQSFNDVLDFIEPLTLLAIEMLSSEEGFGCCSRFIECSDAKKCIHPNKVHSKGCMYRQNLESGRIFFGKNKNV